MKTSKTAKAKSKTKLAYGQIALEGGTLEDKRIREATRRYSQDREARLAAIKAAEKTKAQIIAKVKMPVTLRSVYDTFLRRLKATPFTIMRSEEPDAHSRIPRLVKMEAKFTDLGLSKVLGAMEGLTCHKPVTKMEGMSYSHIAQWGHTSNVIRFRVSLYRYKDKTCLFIFALEPEYAKKPTKEEQQAKEERRAKAKAAEAAAAAVATTPTTPTRVLKPLVKKPTSPKK